MKTKTYEVEFWSGHIIEVTVDERFGEDTALTEAIIKNGWPGGWEKQSNGFRFQAWVREKNG